MRLIVALSGPIAVGKSVFIAEFLKRIKGVRISTRELILSLRDVKSERGVLQAAGESLDHETDGKWVADALALQAKTLGDELIALVDSIRIAKQADHLRSEFGEKFKHLHLSAAHDVLAQRFIERKNKGDLAVLEFATYEEAKANATEAAVEGLGRIADIRINTDQLAPEAAAMLAIDQLGLLGNV